MHKRPPAGGCRIGLVLLMLAMALPAAAAPTTYLLQPEQSTVAFETDFGRDQISGAVPVTRADLSLDFDAVQKSQIAVEMSAAGVKSSLPFATEALKGRSVLDARRFPEMSFRSTAVAPDGAGARVTGILTLRGVARPVTLAAAFWRQKGQARGDLSRMTIRLTGRISRSAFGAGGFADMVADEVRITITARIARAD